MLDRQDDRGTFLKALERWGPNSSEKVSQQQALQYCRNLARGHYENFSVYSLLVPRELRQHFCNVYAYCRWSDDLADELANAQQSLELLDWWERQLERCWQGDAVHPVMIALAETVRKSQLSMEPFKQLLSAFRQDQTIRRYANDQLLLDYCRRSANPVGRIVLALAGVADERYFSLSDSICTGLQLANFCQDMSRDAAIGRIYLPQNRWIDHGIDEETILARRVAPELRHALRDWVRDTYQFFDIGWPLVQEIGGWLARDLQLFARGGVAILQAIAKNDYDVWSRRIELSRGTKLSIALNALLQRSTLPRLERPQ